MTTLCAEGITQALSAAVRRSAAVNLIFPRLNDDDSRKNRELPAHRLPKNGGLSDMAKGRSLDVEHELVEAFRQSGLVNEYLVKILPKALWRTSPPGGRGRSIAAIVAHMQSVRRT